jgi:hypothetical protein
MGVGGLFGRTYYIDNSSGNDGDSGTSKNRAWKLAPAFTGFQGAYQHTPGDKFVFKGEWRQGLGMQWVQRLYYPELPDRAPILDWIISALL